VIHFSWTNCFDDGLSKTIDVVHTLKAFQQLRNLTDAVLMWEISTKNVSSALLSHIQCFRPRKKLVVRESMLTGKGGEEEKETKQKCPRERETDREEVQVQMHKHIHLSSEIIYERKNVKHLVRDRSHTCVRRTCGCCSSRGPPVVCHCNGEWRHVRPLAGPASVVSAVLGRVCGTHLIKLPKRDSN